MSSASKKVVFLIIASGGEAYDQFKVEINRYFTWLRSKGFQYQHFFLYGRDYDTNVRLENSDLVLDCQDSWQGGILAKTSLACKHISTMTYDYCIRTNLSALFHAQSLETLLRILPRSKCYTGIVHNNHGYRFVSGAGMILSPDVVELLASLSDGDKVRSLEKDTMPDDVRIGAVFTQHALVGNRPTTYVRTDFGPRIPTYVHRVHSRSIQFRFKTTDRNQDVVRMKNVIDSIIKNGFTE